MTNQVNVTTVQYVQIDVDLSGCPVDPENTHVQISILCPDGRIKNLTLPVSKFIPSRNW